MGKIDILIHIILAPLYLAIFCVGVLTLFVVVVCPWLMFIEYIGLYNFGIL